MRKKRTKCLVAGVLVAIFTLVSFLPRQDMPAYALLAEYVGNKVVFAGSYQPDIDKAKEYLEELEERQKEAQKRLNELEANKEDLTAYIQELDNEQAYAYEELMQLEAIILRVRQIINLKGTAPY